MRRWNRRTRTTTGIVTMTAAAEMAAAVSCFTYERRGPDADSIQPPAHWPSSKLAKRARAIERVWRGKRFPQLSQYPSASGDPPR